MPELNFKIILQGLWYLYLLSLIVGLVSGIILGLVGYHPISAFRIFGFFTIQHLAALVVSIIALFLTAFYLPYTYFKANSLNRNDAYAIMASFLVFPLLVLSLYNSYVAIPIALWLMPNSSELAFAVSAFFSVLLAMTPASILASLNYVLCPGLMNDLLLPRCINLDLITEGLVAVAAGFASMYFAYKLSASKK
ncbi:MAG: hypothetical protein ABH863_05970 [Candidatus Micrarchaeota archaeon]